MKIFPFRRLAASAPTGFLRSFFATICKSAALADDELARGSYIEGLLGVKPGSIARNAGSHFKAARDAVARGDKDNEIVNVLRDHGMDDKDILMMVGVRDLGFYQQLVFGAQKALHGQQSIRGLSAEDIASSIAMGLSPLTLKWIQYGEGKGAFYHLGANAPPRVSIRGIRSIAGKEAANRTKDIFRRKKKDNWSKSLDAPVGQGGDSDGPSVGDFLAHKMPVSDSQYTSVVSEIFSDPRVLKMMDQSMRNALRTPVQVAVWEAIRTNPDFLLVSSKGIGVSGKALAVEVNEILGPDYPGTPSKVSVGKTFRTHVLPAMQKVLSQGSVARTIERNRDLMEVIQEATQGTGRMASVRRVAARYAQKA